MSARSDELKGGLASFRGSVAITLSDSEDLAKISRGLQCDSGGILKLTFVDDTIDTLTLVSGIAYPYQIKRAWDAGNGVTGVHALY